MAAGVVLAGSGRLKDEGLSQFLHAAVPETPVQAFPPYTGPETMAGSFQSVKDWSVPANAVKASPV